MKLVPWHERPERAYERALLAKLSFRDLVVMHLSAPSPLLFYFQGRSDYDQAARAHLLSWIWKTWP